MEDKPLAIIHSWNLEKPFRDSNVLEIWQILQLNQVIDKL